MINKNAAGGHLIINWTDLLIHNMPIRTDYRHSSVEGPFPDAGGTDLFRGHWIDQDMCQSGKVINIGWIY